IEEYNFQEFSAEKLFSNLNVSGEQLSKNCTQDLDIIINGIYSLPERILQQKVREIDSKLIIPVIDSSGKIGPGILRGHVTFIGSFEQCKAIDYQDNDIRRRIRGGYFRVTLRIPSGNISFTFELDICAPASCSGDELHSVLKMRKLLENSLNAKYFSP
ncbi:unnamed protein product, partial [Strongylus vulgaris]